MRIHKVNFSRGPAERYRRLTRNKKIASIASVSALLVLGGVGVTLGNTFAADNRTIQFEDVNLCNAVVTALNNDASNSYNAVDNCAEGKNIVMSAEGVDGVWQLWATNAGEVTSLVGIEQFSNLSFLELSHDQISDLSTLGNLPKLTELSLFDTGVSDISHLANFPNLKMLSLSNCNVTDISALSAMVKMENLNLTKNNVADLSPLRGLTKMKNLTIYQGLDESVSDISALAGMTELKTLDLGSNYGIQDLTPLQNLVNLESLQLLSDSVIDVTPIEGLSGFNATTSLFTMKYQFATVKTGSRTYALPTLYTHIFDSGSKVYDADATLELSNATINEDNTIVTITDTSQPATVMIGGSSGKALGSRLKLVYEEGYDGTEDSGKTDGTGDGEETGGQDENGGDGENSENTDSSDDNTETKAGNETVEDETTNNGDEVPVPDTGVNSGAAMVIAPDTGAATGNRSGSDGLGALAYILPAGVAAVLGVGGFIYKTKKAHRKFGQ